MDSDGISSADDNKGSGFQYEEGLRAIGAWLDGEDARRGARLFETGAGFAIQVPTDEGDRRFSTHIFSYDEIREFAATWKQRKRRRRAGPSYENILRAIGYEVDAVDGRSLVFEEVEDDLFVSYLYPHYIGGFALMKHAGFLSPEERKILVEKASARRRPGLLSRGISRMVRETP